MAIAAAAIAATQSIMQGISGAASYENQARAQETNSRIAALNAQLAESEGKIAAARTAQDWYKTLGRQRAAMAQGGVLDSPTGQLVLGATEQKAREDEFQVQLKADLKKQGFQFESADLLSQAKVSRKNAKQALLAGYLGAGGSFAAGASQAYAYNDLYSNPSFGGKAVVNDHVRN
jgi:hypothetical protein